MDATVSKKPNNISLFSRFLTLTSTISLYYYL